MTPPSGISTRARIATSHQRAPPGTVKAATTVPPDDVGIHTRTTPPPDTPAGRCRSDTDQKNASTTRCLMQRSDVEDTLGRSDRSRVCRIPTGLTKLRL